MANNDEGKVMSDSAFQNMVSASFGSINTQLADVKNSVLETNKRLGKKIDELTVSVTVLDKWQAGTSVLCKEREKKIQEMHEVLFNKNGIKDVVRDIKQTAKQEKSTKEHICIALRQIIVWGIIGTMVFLLITYQKADNPREESPTNVETK